MLRILFIKSCATGNLYFSVRLLLALFILFSWLSCAPVIDEEATYGFTVETVPEYDIRFSRETGWTGADGAYTVPLGEQKLLWLFSDTWVGDIRDNKHVNATMINNSIALQHGKNPASARLEFFYKTKPDAKPASFLEPTDGRGWFWLDHGVLADSGLYLFLMQIEKTESDSVFGFRHVGAWLGHVANPLEPPDQWRVTQRKIPWGHPSPDGNRTFGSAILKRNNMIYVYGYDEEKVEGWLKRYMILARVPADKIEDFNAWRFYGSAGWVTDDREAARLCDEIATEYSVSFQPYLRKYVLLYTENGLSKLVRIRLAGNPEGPWSQPITVFECPEVEWHSSYFCYAAKAHPFLSRRPNELLFTYVTNSMDFWKMAADARIYRPRFVRITFPKRGKF